MSDPFLPKNAESQLIREAKIGFSIVLLVVFALGCWTVQQYRKFQNQIPDHVRNAPLAKHVGPDEYLQHLDALVALPPAAQSSVNRQRPSESVASRPESNAFDYDKSIDTRLEIERLNDNLDQLSYTVNSLMSLNRSLDPPKIIPRSSNPIDRPHARDLSNDLPRFQRAETIAPTETIASTTDYPPTDQLAGSAVDDRTIEEPNLLQSEARQFDHRVTPVNFEANNQPQFEQENGDAGAKKSSNTTTSDDAFTLEIVDPDPQSAVQTSQLATVADGEELQYRSVSGDSFWSIAQQIYGDGRYFNALFQHNRQVVEDFDDLPVDSRIKTPPVEVLRSRYPDLCPALQSKTMVGGQNYTTVEGDTLFHIARQTTGQASRYVELLKLNRDRLPIGTNHLTRLQANLELRLPH